MMCKKRYLIDGRFLTSLSTGIDRYANQILMELDRICEDVELSILVPANVEKIPEYKNIRVIRSKHSRFWTQGVFALYTVLHRMIPVNLCNEVSLLAPKGIVCLHDVCYAETKDVYPQVDEFALDEIHWFQKLYSRIKQKAAIVITVSEFSKSRIVKLIGIDAEKIQVIGNGWQHFEHTKVQDNLFEEYPQLKEKEYYFTLTSANKNKNLAWVLGAASYNKDETFVIAGKNLDKVADFSRYPNVCYVGYASDELAKALMVHCKAFLFPSFYEGFGIPPLEALSTGAQVVVSKAASLPEIFGETVHYISPTNPKVNLDLLISEPVAKPGDVLSYYSWKNSAEKLYHLLKI